MYSIYDIRKRTHEEDQAAIDAFLKAGGEVVQLKEPSESKYEKYQKKNQQELDGAFNPFSKLDALKVNK